MFRFRAGLILLVAVLYGAAPMAADACARTCASAAPACHHTSSPSAHIGHAPDLCDYAHDAIRPAQPGSRTVDDGAPFVALASTAPSAAPAPGSIRLRAHDSPPLFVPVRSSSAPLRI